MRAVSVVRRHVRGGVPICLRDVARSLKGDTVPQSMRVGTRRALRTDSARAFEAVCRTARWPLVTAPDAREEVAGMTPTADLSGRSEFRPMRNGLEGAATPFAVGRRRFPVSVCNSRKISV